jgi:hypothetical protein
MEYLYRDFDFKNYRVRCVRMLNFPARISTTDHHQSGFVEAGEQPEAGSQLSMHQVDALKALREQMKAENCFVFFDVEDVRLKNRGKELSFFAEGASMDDTDNWEFKIGYLN